MFNLVVCGDTCCLVLIVNCLIGNSVVIVYLLVFYCGWYLIMIGLTRVVCIGC